LLVDDDAVALMRELRMAADSFATARRCAELAAKAEIRWDFTGIFPMRVSFFKSRISIGPGAEETRRSYSHALFVI
jgi:hypothetical protein